MLLILEKQGKKNKLLELVQETSCTLTALALQGYKARNQLQEKKLEKIQTDGAKQYATKQPVHH